ncbi:MFS transporter [Breznakiella homolactica]|uniref:MFS transporter n=1 Tax=Breznakiella homolactica TaxID=2798577 RepID=A0A7T8BAZ0_9SPIR|nr:MFS transporter [Breznakiella homolactica]QQO09992.1 MFS transporter [Breznakiella homolactica]
MDKAKTNWFLVIVLWFAGIAAAMQFAKFSFAFDSLKNQYTVNPFWIGLSLSIVGLIGLVFGITVSIYVPKIGQNKILLISLLLGAVISLIQASNPAFPVLFISRIMEGISHLGIIVTAPAIIIFLSSEKHHSLVMGLWSSFFGVAFSVTAWAGKPIMELFSISGLFLAHAIIMISIFVILFFTIRKIHIPHTEDNKVSFITAHKKVYSNWRTVSPGIIFFFHTFMFIALFTFLPGLSGDEKTKSMLLIILPLISIGGTMAAGIVSQYFVSPSKLSVFAYISLLLLICVIKLSFNNNILFIAASMILILFSGIIQGSVFSLIPKISLSAEEQTNANGVVAQLGNLGSTLGPPVFSYFLVYGKNSIIIIVMLLSILGAVSGLIITKKIKNAEI